MEAGDGLQNTPEQWLDRGPDPLSTPFGDLLRRYRLRVRLSQEELAERSRLSRQAIGALEQGRRRRPYRVTIDLLATALRLTPEERERFAGSARVRQAATPAPTAVRRAQARLPVPPTALVGREEEVEAVRGLLVQEHVRLVTLTGTAGVGKTRVGLAAAAALAPDFGGRVFFAPLAPIADHDLVGEAIRHAMGLHETRTRSLIETLVGALDGERTLLLLDNFEHLLPAIRLLAELLALCPRVSLLVTSRERLNLRGEHVVVVPPLPLPDLAEAPDRVAATPSAALFVRSARTGLPDLRVTADNAPLVASICRRLDGLPLALELAAARTRLLPLDALLERLGDRLDVLVGGPSDLPAHQRTMRATLEWSCGMLSDGERAVFRRLAVFAGGASLDATLEVCDAPPPGRHDLLPALEGLLDKNMLQREPVRGHARLTMLETIRQFAHEQLVASGELGRTRRAHAAHHIRLAETAELALKGPALAEWLDRLDLDHDNLRAVLGWARDGGRIEMGLDLAGRLWRFWQRRGHWREGLAWLDGMLARAEGVRPEVRAKALNAAANLAWQSDHDQTAVRRRYEASLDLYRALGDRNGIGRVLNNLGNMLQDGREHRAAMTVYEESLALLRASGDDHSVANCLDNLGNSASALNDLERGARLLNEAFAIRQRVGDSLGLSRSFLNLGVVRLRQGDGEGARELVERGLELTRRLGDEGTLALGLSRRAEVSLVAGEDRQAYADYVRALAMALRLGAMRIAIMCLCGLAALAARHEAFDDAACWCGAAAAACERTATPPEPGHVHVQGAARRALGETRFAARFASGRRLLDLAGTAPAEAELAALGGSWPETRRGLHEWIERLAGDRPRQAAGR